MKLIFLDIDGVIRKDSDGVDDLNPRMVSILNDIIVRTGAKVVISSDWRKYFSLDELRDMFKAVGFRGDIIGVTADNRINHLYGTDYIPRGIVIKDFVDGHNPDAFIIIDDNTVGGKMDCHLVRTNPKKGLTEFEAGKVIRRLNANS